MSTPPNDSMNDLFSGMNFPSPTQSLLDMLEQSDANEAEIQLSSPQRLEIIAQPYCSSRARYRSEYISSPNRREPLVNKNPRYNGPAVFIPPIYLDITNQYYIGVSLATLIHEKTNCWYIHPYELESIDDKDRNDRDNNIVWFSIEGEDLNGIKSFPDVHVVRKTEDELVSYGNLRPIHGSNSNLFNNVTQKVLSKRQIVPEYNLKKGQLAFFIGQKKDVNDRFPTIIDPDLPIFSDELILVPDQETVEDNESTQSNPSPPPDCDVDKYAPRYGFTEGNDQMLIFFTKKLEEKKYGKLQITFVSVTPNIVWSEEVAADSIEVKGQMVSFRIPALPSINEYVAVKIVLKQRERIFKPIEYFYIQKSQCLTCQTKVMNTPNPITRNNSNKRTKPSLNISDDETDAMVPVSESNPVFLQSKSEPVSNSSNTTSPSSITNNQINPDGDLLSTKLYKSIELLFKNNDFKPLLRSCRPFIRKRPELIHEAISKNYSDLVTTFVPVAGIELLQHKNHLGETVLLHAAHLNHVNTIKALLEREKSDKLLEDTNDKEQNIFHILALNTNSNEILDLFIDYLLKNSIDISEKFDHIDKDNHTPLQLAISNNNLPATRHLLKYFNKNIRETSNNIGDNLIHLAVRYGDLTMLKYLLNEGQLIEQGSQTNLVMTPIELARSINRDDMMEYFKEKYPPPEIDEDENSHND